MANPADDMVRSYGPGKFATLLDAYIWDWSLDGCDESSGDVDATGCWSGLLRGPLAYAAPAEGSFVEALNSAEITALEAAAGFIVQSDDQGFVSVTDYATEEELEAAWQKILTANEEAYGPQEEDWTTPDYQHIYENGRLILTIPEEADFDAAIRAKMEAEGYFPNLWVVSDHGNAMLIDLTQQ